jgi:hypothetical protein
MIGREELAGREREREIDDERPGSVCPCYSSSQPYDGHLMIGRGEHSERQRGALASNRNGKYYIS